MKHNPLKWPISCITGIFVILIYCIFTLIAFILFSGPFSPLTHWLSDLGNSMSNYNPFGAIYYNLGCIFTGIALFPFYIGLYKWYSEKKWSRLFLKTAQIIGFLSAFALIMIGIFSEEYIPQHQFWGFIFFISNLCVLILASISLSTHPYFPKSIIYYSFGVIAINLIFIIILLIPLYLPILEWFSVFTALGFVGIIVYNTFKLESLK